jgi:hypothetical protein
MKKLAQILSYLFHPIYMPLAGFFIIFNSGIYESNLSLEYKKYAYMVNLLFTVFLPLALVSLLLYVRQIPTVQLNDRKHRNVPLLLTSVSLFSLFLVLHRVFPLPVIQGFSLAIFSVVLILTIINLRFKISIHLGALGGISGLVLVIAIFYHKDLFIYLTICLMASGLVASSRLLLKAHNLKEISSGYFVGFFVTFFIVLYFIKN